MICNNCFKRDVCKHKEYLDKYIGLELSGCSYKKAENNTSAFPNITTIQNTEPRMTREEVNEKIAELTKLNEEPPKLREIAICEICNEADYKDQMHECAECGRLVCDDCSLELLDHNADSENPMTTDVMCNECWEKVGLEEEKEEGDDDE